jgi:hypothetical protein
VKLFVSRQFLNLIDSRQDSMDGDQLIARGPIRVQLTRSLGNSLKELASPTCYTCLYKYTVYRTVIILVLYVYEAWSFSGKSSKSINNI